MGGKYDNKEGDLIWEHPFPKVSGYKRGSDIKEGDITVVRVYLHPLACLPLQWHSPVTLTQAS